MDIAKLRSQTAMARTSKKAIEDAEFNDSPIWQHPLWWYIDKRIKKAAKIGKYEISLNYYYAKKQVLGDKHDGPSIETAIRHYSNEGFSVRKEYLLSPNGYGNMSLNISWM